MKKSVTLSKKTREAKESLEFNLSILKRKQLEKVPFTVGMKVLFCPKDMGHHGSEGVVTAIEGDLVSADFEGHKHCFKTSNRAYFPKSFESYMPKTQIVDLAKVTPIPIYADTIMPNGSRVKPKKVEY